jgi:signal transduction histidine kinase
MSYRSFKRVLGETNLERKCRFLFGACLLVLITGSFWWYGKKTDELVYDQNRFVGQGLVDAVLAVQHWEVLETNEQFQKTIASLVEKMRNQDYRYRLIKPESPDGEGKPHDELEWQLLERWQNYGSENTGEGEESKLFAQRHAPDESQYRYQYYQPIYAKQDCVACHRAVSGNQTLAEGDLLAIVQIGISDEQTVRAQNKNRSLLITLAIATVFLSMVALYVIVRYVIVKPLTHLRDVSNEISRGRLELRADINTGDEFEELAEAFNRMLRHLSGAQDELRDVNSNLDKKVDELAQANMRLYEMNRLKGDFLATVSHELRTPLNSIIGFSDILDSADALGDKQRRYVKNIQQSGRMLLDMINDILDLAKIESGKMEIRPSEFRIEQLIGSQCDMARPLTEKKNIDLEYEIEPGLPALVQDQGKVQQILNNLLSNAIKFTPEGGRIIISASRRAGGALELVVTDTGVGIAIDEQVAVFEKFRQGNTVLPSGDAMTREYSGTGLGLSIVKELCRLLGGEVVLESELGKGSAFTVRLPWTIGEQSRLSTPLADEVDQLTHSGRLDYIPETAINEEV